MRISTVSFDSARSRLTLKLEFRQKKTMALQNNCIENSCRAICKRLKVQFTCTWLMSIQKRNLLVIT